jgi:hypothetical protein
MAHVEKRQPQTEGGAVRYRVRFIDPAGRERSKSFRLKGEADRFAHSVEADKARGAYVDPAAGRITLEEYGAVWLAAQTSTHQPTRQPRSGCAYTCTPTWGRRRLQESALRRCRPG